MTLGIVTVQLVAECEATQVPFLGVITRQLIQMNFKITVLSLSVVQLQSILTPFTSCESLAICDMMIRTILLAILELMFCNTHNV